MSFVIFQLVFAVIALALVVVAGLIVRQILGKRARPAEPAREAEPKASKLRMPSLRKQPAEPEPETEAPAPARRRQLNSFAEAERSAAEAEAVVLPVLEPAIAEPAEDAAELADAPAATFEQAPEPAEEAALDAEHMTEQALDYSEAVLGRLEEAFEDLQDGDISLETYRERLLVELAAVERHVAEAQHGGDSADLEAAMAARDSVRWCLDWADEQAGAQEVGPATARH